MADIVSGQPEHVEFFGRDRRDRNRNLLDIFLAFFRRHGDDIEGLRALVGACWSGLRDRGGSGDGKSQREGERIYNELLGTEMAGCHLDVLRDVGGGWQRHAARTRAL